MPNEQELTMQDVQLLVGTKELNILLLQREVARLRQEVEMLKRASVPAEP